VTLAAAGRGRMYGFTMSPQIHPLFARAPRSTSTLEPLADIVARVRQPAGLKLALSSLRELQARYAALSDEQRQAIAALQAAGGDAAGPSASPLTTRVVELNSQLRALSDKLRGALEAVIAARPPWIAAVVAALAPHRRAAAGRALAAAAALETALDLLADIDDQIVAVGGSPGRLPLPAYRATLGLMADRLRQQAE
jgi:hypothetical protein